MLPDNVVATIEDAERLLFQRAHEILSLVRSYGASLRLNIEINTNVPEEVMFIVNKKMANPNEVTIRNQKLSIREIEILGLIMQGHTGNQIADKLCISYAAASGVLSRSVLNSNRNTNTLYLLAIR